MATAKIYAQDQISSMSDEDLMSAWDDLAEHAQQVREGLVLFSHEHQNREDQRRAREHLAAMSDGEKMALLQEIQSDGADGVSAVGKPGGK